MTPELALLAAAAIALVAMFVRGLTGFGDALIMTPLLLLVFDAKLTIVAAGIVQAVVGVRQLAQVRGLAGADYLRLLLPAGLLSVVAGSVFIVQFDSSLLRRGLGLVIVLFALRTLWTMWAGPGTRTRWPRPLGHLAAVISGILGALFGTSGPPIVVFLENQIDSGAVLRATLIAYFAIIDVVRLGGYALGSLVTPQALLTGGVMLPAALAGAWTGTRLHMRLNERVFRVVVASLLLLAGVLLAAT